MRKSLLLLFLFTHLLPGTTFSQEVDTTGLMIHNWMIDPASMLKNYTSLDTSLTRFQVINKAYIEGVSVTSLGNLGSPAKYNTFFNRYHFAGFPFLSVYMPYMHKPEQTLYFNTRKPFTELAYSTAGTKVNLEQTLRLIHTQNVNRDFNVGIFYDLISAEGQYTNQRAVDKAFSFFSSYEKTKYSLFLNASLFQLKMSENGGIVADEDLGENDPKDLAVNLVETFNNSRSQLGSRSLYLAHKYRLLQRPQAGRDSLSASEGESRQLIEPSISHLLNYSFSHRKYLDDFPSAGFYDTVLISNQNTKDSVYFRNLQNVVRFEFLTDTTRRFSFLGRIGLVSELQKYSSIIPVDTLITERPPTVVIIPGGTVTFYNNDTTFRHTRQETFHNLGLNFFMQSSFSRYVRWNFLAEMFFSGYKQGDLLLTGGVDFNIPISRVPLRLATMLRIEKNRPEYFYQHFSSNHFTWKNRFVDQASSVLQATLSAPRQKFETGFRYGLFDNMICLDTAARPAQTAVPVSIIALHVNKHFEAGKFRSINRLYFQLSSQEEIISLPLVSLYHSTWFEYRIHFRLTDGTIYYQLGYDLYYNTPFYADAYMPATGLFHNQQEKKLGNYPFLDVFLNLRLKRARFFLKFQHVNSGLLHPAYFGALHYPLNQRMFKFGVSWTFHD